MLRAAITGTNLLRFQLLRPSVHTQNVLNSFIRREMSSRGPLQFADGPMVWCDCEMTGLNHRKDKVIEIAILITDKNLETVDEGIEYVIRTDKETLDNMNDWCVRQHGLTGLTAACLASPHTSEFVSQAVLEYIKKWIPNPRTAVLAGNSVHCDRYFLCECMPEVIDWLHHRIVDVSSIKELARRWYPDFNMPRQPESNHRALSDIRNSIAELKFYREKLFKDPSESVNMKESKTETKKAKRKSIRDLLGNF